MQIFLNFNSIYWCFAPLRHTEVEVQNRRSPTLPSPLLLLDPIYATSIGSKDRNARLATETTRSDESVRSYMRNLPPVPDGYSFSIQQRARQFQYFKHQHDLIDQQNPSIDLFTVDIIAVCQLFSFVINFYHSISLVPEDASEAVRRFVEALFITHAETNLNTSGRLVIPVNDDSNRKDDPFAIATTLTTPSLLLELQLLDREEWCLDLIFPHHRTWFVEQ